MGNHPPAIVASDAEALASDRYDLPATATPLPSDRDQNFLLTVAGEPRLVLKIASADEEPTFLAATHRAMQQVAGKLSIVPRLEAMRDGQVVARVNGPGGPSHLVWAVSFLPGIPLGRVPHRTSTLWHHFGATIGQLTQALAGFDDPAIHRTFQWDLAQGRTVVGRNRATIEDASLAAAIGTLIASYDCHTAALLPLLRQSALHGDLNDYNILVGGGAEPFDRFTAVTGILDFGDMVHGATISDLAIALAYAVLDSPDPLSVMWQMVHGYHEKWAMTEGEMQSLWGLAMLRLCVSASLAVEQQASHPDNAYLGVSQAPIRRTLPRLAGIPFPLAAATVRSACGLEPVAASGEVRAFLSASTASFAPVLGVDLRTEPSLVLDLSVGSPLVRGDSQENAEPALTKRIFGAMQEAGVEVGVGRYDEPRLLYVVPAFAAGDGTIAEHRTIHIGLDLFAAAGTPVFAPLDGVVHVADERALPLDYGGVILLKHLTDDGTEFFTLYGHLRRESFRGLRAGQRVARGEQLACLGDPAENGGWTPHLHLQIITDLLGLGSDFPGVATPSRRDVWRSVSPDPNLLVGVPAELFPPETPPIEQALARRRALLGPSVRVAYRRPLRLARGWMQHLYDDEGHRFLDAYNNVPHVGHCHPRVVAAAARQMAVLNTNTRYLQAGIAEYAARLTATLPGPLSACFLVSSASEANELAIRLAREYTGRRDMLVLEAAYHGNTSTLIDISPYKHAGPGGLGAPEWVHVAPLADDYRGRYQRGDPHAGPHYAGDLARQVDSIRSRGRELAAFIAESCPSVGGQIIFPAGYLAGAYHAVRAVGGLCIADEVQTGLGRLGTHFWGFETQRVVPDIVVMGKPLGNGHPLAAVVTTRAIAEAFDNGMEYFSTFGGNTVSCAVGTAVLDVMRDEALQEHALRVGSRLLDGLRAIAPRHALVGDVRGSGLFIGVELVRDQATLEPAAREADYVANRMREEGILLGTDGPLHNVVKIRPPMPFDDADSDRLLETLDRVLGELER